ncbi:MAG: Urea transporter [uncultured bacterium]|nr:MAG: Urea transporter [uncultured bacterium]
MHTIKIFLRGFSEVMLQNNAVTGLFFLAGIIYNSYPMAIGAVLGNIISTYLAVILKYNNDDIIAGNYGFNGVLVGIASVFFLGLNAPSIALLVIGSLLSTLVMKKLSGRNLPALTAPFVISTWIILVMAIILKLFTPSTTSFVSTQSFLLLQTASEGFGQVMFQGNVVTGILFLIGLFVSSFTVGLFSLFGTLFGAILAMIFQFPMDMINIGLFGFNAVLCGIAFSGKNIKSLLPAAASILLSVLIMFGMLKLNIITLTAPFVLATWIVKLIPVKK